MNCNEAIDYIHSLEKFGMRPGLERIEALCRALGDPQKGLNIIHVAGTNGKGSTSTIIASILQKAGYGTGLFISPYVSDFRERIQYNGAMIEPSELAECVYDVKNAIEADLAPNGLQPTEFEAVTAAALLFFKRKKCDYAVLEVGLGGRFDSTNIIDPPRVGVITSISLDHMAILGDTVEKIAFEKCGIIKPGSEIVAYPLQDEKALAVIREACAAAGDRLTLPDTEEISVVSESLEGTKAVYGGLPFELRLAGKHMVYNTCTAIEAVRVLHADISDEAIADGIASAVMPARLELISREPVMLLDGGHNEGCAEAVAEFIGKHLSGRRIVMLSSLMADKDVDGYLLRVAPFAAEFIAARADVPRAMDAEALRTAASAYCADCRAIASPSEALEYAVSRVKPGDALIVCGSFYLAGEIRAQMLNYNK